MKITEFAIDERLEIEGVWCYIGQGASLLVARDGNPRFMEAMRKKMSTYRTQFQVDNITDEEATAILIEAIAETILLGWKGIEDDEGKELIYSRENSIKYLTKYNDFRKLVANLSANNKRYREAIEEEAIDNAKK